MPHSRYPSLYQVNTRVWLNELSRKLGRAATLDDIPDGELDRLSDLGFDWLWLLSVWKTSLASRAVSRSNPAWRQEFADTLPALHEGDIGGSGFAIEAYDVSPALGGNAELARLRKRMQQRGLRLMLDFVPNHMGLAHPWLRDHADYFIAGSEDDLAREPHNYCRVSPRGGTVASPATENLILAYGRDPYFPGWPDALQLNYGNPTLQAAMIGELLKIAGLCDGVRCDMAMLLLPDVFERTWGVRMEPFWPRAIAEVRQRFEKFQLLAEVYWDREWDLQQQGFDYTYDKRLYDRLHAGAARPVREHFYAGLDFQNKLARFLENHDEPRAAASFPLEVHKAAAVLTYLSPGMRFFHQGQFTGRTKRVSPHLVRRPEEPVNREIAGFYEKLLTILRDDAYRQRGNGQEPRWRLLECAPAWDGNPTHDNFVAWMWSGENALHQELVVVNYAATQGQSLIKLPVHGDQHGVWNLEDRLSEAVSSHESQEFAQRALFLDLKPWQCQAFRMSRSV